MNWTMIGSLAELAATVAVFITLVYLAVQVRTGNKQAELEGLRHTLESWYRHVVQTSRDKAYTAVQFENFEAAVQEWLMHPGGRVVWEKYKQAFPLVADFIDDALAKIDAADP